jgi:regulator of RNase E activity RraA
MNDSNARKVLPALRHMPVPILSDALDRLGIEGAMANIEMLNPKVERMAGIARTIQQSPIRGDRKPGEFHVRHVEMTDAHLGEDDVVVIGVLEDCGASSWGHLLSLRSRMLKAAGTVTDGTIRDPAEIAELGYPVFYSGRVCPVGSKYRLETIAFDEPIVCARVLVRPGDIIVGDASGVVVIPPDRIDEVIKIANEILTWEEETARRISQGGPLRKPAP